MPRSGGAEAAQGLKPPLIHCKYVRAEARTLQETSFFAACSTAHDQMIHCGYVRAEARTLQETSFSPVQPRMSGSQTAVISTPLASRPSAARTASASATITTVHASTAG